MNDAGSEVESGHGDADDQVARMMLDIANVALDPAPPPVRSAVLTAVRQRTAARRPPQPEQVPLQAAPFAAQVIELDTLLAELTGSQWGTPVVHGWNVAELLAHLFAVDAMLAAGLGLPIIPECGNGDIAARTAVAQRTFADRPPGDVHDAWRGQVIALLRHVTARPEQLKQSVSFLGREIAVATALLDRTAEAWIHAEDIRSALGLPSRPPRTADVDALVTGGVRALRVVWPVPAPPIAGNVLLRLPGARPAGWLIDAANGTSQPLPDGQAPKVKIGATVAIDPVEFCYLLGGRRTPATARHDSAGDPLMVQATLTAAAGLARL